MCSPRSRSFPGVRPDPEALVEALDPLQPRLYSIASVAEGRRQAHGALRRCRALSHQRPPTPRVASTFLAERVNPGDRIKVYVQKAGHFGLPARPIGAGHHDRPRTGIAPFRAFLYERMATKAPRPQLAVLRPPAQQPRLLLRGRARWHERPPAC